MALTLRLEDEQIILTIIESYITNNPILISNLIESSVNGIISDSDIPLLIKAKISEKLNENTILQSYGDDRIIESINEILSEMLQDKSTVIDAAIEGRINTYVESSEFGDKINAKLEELEMDDIVSNAVDSRITARDLEESVSNAIEEALPAAHQLEEMVTAEIQSTLEEEGINQESVTAIISDKLDVMIDDAQVNQRIENAINGKLNNLEPLIKELVEQKLQTLVPSDAPVVQLPPTVTSIPPTYFIKILSEDIEIIQSIYKLMKSQNNITVLLSEGL